MWGKPYLGSLFVTFSLLLSSCSSSSNEQTSEIDANIFSARNFMDSLTEQYQECELKYIGESRITTDDLWKSKRWSEVEKYSWIEYSDFIDYYEFQMDDPSFGDYDLADAANAKNCIDFLSSEMTRLEGFFDGEATALLSLYKELFENKTKYLVPAESIVALLPLTNGDRSDYLKLEDQKRKLEKRNKELFYSIRALIDYYNYAPGVKVYLEKCPTAFTNPLDGRDYNDDGSALLVNESGSNRNVSFTVRFKEGGVIIGSDFINENVPANSKVRALISASGSSEAVRGGISFPPVCSLDFEGS